MMRFGRASICTRSLGVLMILVVSASLPASCSSASKVNEPSKGNHTYMLTGPSVVWWIEVQVGQGVTGAAEQVDGPGLTSDRRIHDYNYRLVGTLSGDTISFRLVPTSRDVRGSSVTNEATISDRRFASGPPEVVFTAASRKQFDAAVSVRTPLWKSQEAALINHP